jgi:ribA/ribD-fused uncharacterized protein
MWERRGEVPTKTTWRHVSWSMVTIAFRRVSEKYGWLGNMYACRLVYQGRQYRTAEALFQAVRFSDEGIREEIRACPSPMRAKWIARSHRERMKVAPQSAEDLALMEMVLRLKLSQHPELAARLRATGDALIVEDCTLRDRGSSRFWGAVLDDQDGWVGENHLGRLWMKLRGELSA